MKRIAISILTSLALTVASSSATSKEWCSTGGTTVDRLSCIRVSGGGYANICNTLVFFYYCYDDAGSYSCGYNRQPTQFGGIAPGDTLLPSYPNRPIYYWAFSCE